MLNRFEAFVGGVSACYKYIQRIKSAEMTEFGLKGTHVMCLYFLHHAPEGLTAAKLSTLCAEDKAAISRTVAVLQEKGYVQSAGKKYRANLQLTDSGTAIAERVDSLIEQWVSFGGEGLSQQERDSFYKVLGLISENLKNNIDRSL